jgi:hypothetical protein
VQRRKLQKKAVFTKQEYDQAFNEKRAKVFSKFDHNSYPEEFLVFLLHSVPAENAPEEICASLNGGNAGIDAVVHPTATARELTDADNRQLVVGGRDARRTAAAATAAAARGEPGGGRGAGGRGGAGARGGAGRAEAGRAEGGGEPIPAAPKQVQVTHTVTVETPQLEKRISALNQLIALTRAKTTMTVEAKNLKLEALEHQLEILLEEQILG